MVLTGHIASLNQIGALLVWKKGKRRSGKQLAIWAQVYFYTFQWEHALVRAETMSYKKHLLACSVEGEEVRLFKRPSTFPSSSVFWIVLCYFSYISFFCNIFILSCNVSSICLRSFCYNFFLHPCPWCYSSVSLFRMGPCKLFHFQPCTFSRRCLMPWY